MSDSDTTDSDCGVRYKTTTTRHKHSSSTPSSSRNQSERSSYREEHHSSSSRYTDRRRYRRSRSKTPDRRRHRRRSRSADSVSRSRPKHYDNSRSSKRDSSPVSRRKDAAEEKVLDISVSSVSSQDDQTDQQQSGEMQNLSDECFGPALPPNTSANSSNTLEETPTENVNDEMIGPALPPQLLNRKASRTDEPIGTEPRSIGPALPPGFSLSQMSDNERVSSESELSPFSDPEEEDEEEAEGIIGPLPGTSSSRVNVELEQRALELKIRQMEDAALKANGSGSSGMPKAREDWMLELPDIRKVSDMGLGARQFRTREKLEIGDRSVWTDTPADRERKRKTDGPSERLSKHADEATERERERERSLIAKRDKEQEKMVKQHKKKHKRDKTLLEIHQSKISKEKKASSDSSEPTRRPFDRNLDLHANRFDDAQKKAIMKKAQLLNSRFSSGSSKYL